MTAPTALARPPRVRAARLGVAITFGALGGLTALVLARNPLEQTIFPRCPFNALTGGFCPGCGATRASYLLLHGDLGGALRHNALWVVTAPFVAYALVAWALAAFGRPVLPRLTLGRNLAITLLVALVGFFALRNLPFAWADALNPPGGV